MTNEAWIQGMKELAACLPDKEQEEAVLSLRGEVYRRELNALTDESWLYAVRQAVRNGEWYPTVAALLNYAMDAPDEKPPATAYLPEPRAVSRDEFRKGFETFKRALEAHGIDVSEVGKMGGEE